MQEVKIQCDCGQRYKFDVEPVGGRMPFTVNCPICKLDGTAKANEVLRVGGGVPLAPAPISIAAPAPVPVMAAAPAPIGAPAMAAGAPKLRVSGVAPVAEAPAAPPPIGTPALGAPQRIGGVPQPFGAATGAPAAASGKKPSFMLGFAGAAIGATVGGLIYFLIFYYSGIRLTILGVGVGYLTGLGAELLGRKEGSKELGVIAAVLTIVGILGAQYFVARSWWHKGGGDAGRTAASAYDAAVSEAKKVVAAVPSGTDEEIRNYLAKDDADADQKPDPKSITAEEIKDFRDTTLKEMQALASGQVTKVAFEKKAADAEKDSGGLSDEGTFNAVFLLLLLNKVSLFSLVGGAGLAFKVSSNA